MNTHELLNREDPHCLFCHDTCYITGAGKHSGQASQTVYSDEFTCNGCNESFTVHYYDGQEPFAFDFTCGPLLVVHHYDTNYLVLRRWGEITTDSSRDNPIGIRYFELDFSDKEKLLAKLKTYMLFA